MHSHIYEIQRQHWNMTATRNGLAHGGEDIISDRIARTPNVIAKVRTQRPTDFPETIARSVFAGMQEAANKLKISSAYVRSPSPLPSTLLSRNRSKKINYI
ncbi:hypothetical protein [Glaciimonas sp. PCH181]|uniref:hypothetical protein n=1 Tax=Glaciimonas sp. PCH181 TaxID=2133943 RepID=UPI000D398D5C|nr:hypothetical protein [Glaciimonas sp. PCH181]PUA17554.1 hypothetical protein C7W93_16835 [Glaciimonas sp. PCH181]